VTNKHGLCRTCNESIVEDLAGVLEELNKAQEMLQHSRSTKKRLEKCEGMLKVLALVQDTYESKGIFMLQPTTDEWVAQIHSWREPIIIEGAVATAERDFQKADNATMVKDRAHYLRHASTALAEASVQLSAPSNELVNLQTLAEVNLSNTLKSTDSEVAAEADRRETERLRGYLRETRMRLLSAGIDLVCVIGAADPCPACQAAIHGGPYSLSGDDSHHRSFDGLLAANEHLLRPGCHCAVVADTSDLDRM
jgi:hypothetical protein